MHLKWTTSSPGRQIVAAALLVLLSCVIRWLLFSELGRGIPYLTYYPAVILAAIYGGFVGGLISTLLSALLSLYWTQQGRLSAVEGVAFAVFILICLMITSLSEALHRAWRKAESVQALLKEELAGHEETERSLKAANRLYATLGRISLTALHTVEGESFFEAICRDVVAVGGFRMAWIGLVDDAAQCLRPISHAGFENGYLKEIVLPVGTGASQGPTNLSIQEGRVVTNNDTRTNPGMAPWREAALARGYASSAAVPLRCQNKVIGALTLYAGEPGFFSTEETRLLDQIGEVVSFALDSQWTQAEKIHTRQSLQESEAWFQIYMEHAEDSLFVHDFEGRILDVNRQASLSLGYSREELLGMTVLDFEVDYTLEALKSALTKVNLGEAVTFAGHHRRKDGTVFPIEIRLGAFDALGGRRYIGLVRDITERKRMEDELRDSTERLRLATEASGVGIWQWNIQSNEIQWSEQMFQLYGIDPTPGGMVDYNTWANAVLPEDLPRQEEILQQTLRDRGGSRREFRIRRADNGEIRHIQAVEVVRVNQQGAVEWVLGTNLDFTESEQAEEQLRQAGRFLQATIDALSAHLCVLDQNGVILATNRAWNQFIEANPPRAQRVLPGANYLDVCDEVSAPDSVEAKAFAAGIRSVISCQCDAYSQEYPCHSPSEERWYLARVTRFFDAASPRVVVAHENISDQKRAEARIRELNGQLEERIRQRTKQLEMVNQEQESFCYSVSHDLRAPLRSIDGFSRILLEDYQDKLDDAGKDSLGRVRAATQRMGILIEDLLTLSRLTRAEMHVVPVDLSALAILVANELERAEPERRVKFVIEPGLVAQADAGLIRSVLENLMGNAWKYSSKKADAQIEFGALSPIDLEFPPKTDSGLGSVTEKTFFVSDNGAGFDMAYVDRLFGAFQRLHTVAEFPGSGIGLATVQRILHRHNGRIWAEGRVDQGATFYFTLPEQSL